MGAEIGDHRVVLTSSISAGNPSWHIRDEIGNRTAGEQVTFARPSITTGASLPWNVKKRTNFGPPRAFSHLQTLPAITLLSNKHEGTKLVYSKELESPVLAPPESPFQQPSQLGIVDEESVSKDTELCPADTVVKLNPLQAADRAEGNHLDSVQSSSCAIAQAAQGNDDNSAGGPMSHQYQVIHKTAQPKPEVSRANKLIQPEIKIEQKQSHWMRPVMSLPETKEGSLAHASFKGVGTSIETDPCTLYARDLADPTAIQSSSFYKSSGDSSHLRLSDAVQPSTCSDSFQLTEADLLDGHSRSHSFAGTKRRVAASAGDDGQPRAKKQKESKANMRSQQRIAKRRLTNRASAVQSAEKKTQELSRMERQIEQLQNEHSELQVRWKNQVEACNGLQQSLDETTEKLRLQEEENYKLKTEMDFLRGNLALLPQSTDDSVQSGHEGLPPEVTSMPTNLDWNPDFPFPTSMPTQAEIAADLELDRQLLQDSSGQEYVKEWQLW